MRNIFKHKFAKIFIILLIITLVLCLILLKPKDNTLEHAQVPKIPKPEVALPPEPEEEPDLKDKYLAGKTVDEAWKTLLSVWKNHEPAYNLGIYTYMTKYFIKDNQAVPEYTEGAYKILKKDGYAIVTFEDIKYQPVFFCAVDNRWKYDAFHQRKIIRKSEDSWGAEKYISPYSAILRRLPEYERVDIPIEKEDIYRIENDQQFVEDITSLEYLYKNNRLIPEKAQLLARLYAISTQGAKAIPILKQLEQKMPNNPDVYKYLAISYVDAMYDYASALSYIKKYIKLKPNDEFGHSFLGYLYMQQEKNKDAEAEFNKSIQINPQSCYANTKIFILKAKPENKNYKQLFRQAQQSCQDEDYERFIWLIQWLHKGS